MTNTWVAVDKDGTEKVSNSVFIRRKYVRNVWWGLTKVFYSKNQRNKWANQFSTDESDALPYGGAILPKGSIKKLIGRKLTWSDEPVELKEE